MAKPRKKTGESVSTENAVLPHTVGDTMLADAERDRIAARAYELYLERGGGDGRDMEDWLVAERELRSGSTGSNGDH